MRRGGGIQRYDQTGSVRLYKLTNMRFVSVRSRMHQCTQSTHERSEFGQGRLPEWSCSPQRTAWGETEAPVAVRAVVVERERVEAEAGVEAATVEAATVEAARGAAAATEAAAAGWAAAAAVGAAQHTQQRPTYLLVSVVCGCALQWFG